MNPASLLAGSVRLSATGPLPPEEVWDRYTRPSRWTQWSPHLREVDYPDAVVRPGTTGRVTGVGGVVAVFRIDAVDHRARRWSWSVRSGPLRLSFDHGVEAVVPGSGAPGLGNPAAVEPGLGEAVAAGPGDGQPAGDGAPSGSVAAGGSTAWLVTHALWPVALGYAPLARVALGRLVTPS